MPTLNTAAQNYMASASGSCCGDGSLIIMAGATTVATHALGGFAAPNNGVVSANPIASVNFSSSGTASSAKMVESGREMTLTVGLEGSGAEVILSTLNCIAGTVSEVISVTITYPGS